MKTLLLQDAIVPLWFMNSLVYIVMAIATHALTQRNSKIQNNLIDDLVVYLFWPCFLFLWMISNVYFVVQYLFQSIWSICYCLAFKHMKKHIFRVFGFLLKMKKGRWVCV